MDHRRCVCNSSSNCTESSEREHCCAVHKHRHPAVTPDAHEEYPCVCAHGMQCCKMLRRPSRQRRQPVRKTAHPDSAAALLCLTGLYHIYNSVWCFDCEQAGESVPTARSADAAGRFAGLSFTGISEGIKHAAFKSTEASVQAVPVSYELGEVRFFSECRAVVHAGPHHDVSTGTVTFCSSLNKEPAPW